MSRVVVEMAWLIMKLGHGQRCGAHFEIGAVCRLETSVSAHSRLRDTSKICIHQTPVTLGPHLNTCNAVSNSTHCVGHHSALAPGIDLITFQLQTISVLTEYVLGDAI